MLDSDLLAQVQSHFSTLENKISFVLQPSSDAKFEEVQTMLSSLVSTSPQLSLRIASASEIVRDPGPVCFDLYKNDLATGIRFRAIPGGHEFSSLILAILHIDGKGRWPDVALKSQVRALSGPIQLRTYISLSCTNCPDVVQALNQMALIHPNFKHETIDGDLLAAEVQAHGIQGVPAVFMGDRLIHSGKANFGELLETLSRTLGSARLPSAITSPDTPTEVHDLAILGGGPAGVSAALYLARKGLKVAIIASRIGGQVNDTLAIDNLVTIPSTQGPQLAADLRANLAKYPVTLLENRRIERLIDGQPKTIALSGGESILAQQVIIATGAAWRQLGIPGEQEYIGRGVAFCPHCDGPFFAGKAIAVVGGGNSGVEAAIDLAAICQSVLLLEYLPQLKADQVLVDKLLSLPNVRVLTNVKTSAVIGNGSNVTALSWVERSTDQAAQAELAGIFVQIGLSPNSAMVRDVVACNRAGEIEIDSHNRTNVPGIYAAGDVSTVPYKQIIIAMGEGAKAALAAFEDRLRLAK